MISIRSDARFVALCGAMAMVLGLGGSLRAQNSQDEPSIEVMRATAREKVKEQSAFIKARVIQAIAVFRDADKVSERKLADEHEALIELGLGVLPPLFETFLKTESANVLHQISTLLVRLVAEKRATIAEVSGPVRDLLDQAEPMRAAAAVSILGWIGDQGSGEDIRLLRDRKEPEVRAAVIEALARLNDKDVREQFDGGMASESPLVRIAVLRAIRLIGSTADVPHILAGIEDRDLDVAIAAIRAIEGVTTNSKAMRALHDQLQSPDDVRIRTAIEVIVRIGNKDSANRLAALVTNETRAYDLRLQAAKAMFTLGSAAGMETLAQPLEGIIRNNPKDSRNYQQLAEFYADFGAWDDAAKKYEKAIELVKNSAARQNELRLEGARCWARAAQYKRAAAHLKALPAKDDWSNLASDPAFEKMKEDRRYSSHFEPR